MMCGPKAHLFEKHDHGFVPGCVCICGQYELTVYIRNVEQPYLSMPANTFRFPFSPTPKMRRVLDGGITRL